MLIAFIYHFAVVSLAICDNQDVTFEEWRREYDREYRSVEEYDFRREIYHKILQHIQMLSILHPEIEFKANQFADISPEEFKANILMTSRPPLNFTPLITTPPNPLRLLRNSIGGLTEWSHQ